MTDHNFEKWALSLAEPDTPARIVLGLAAAMRDAYCVGRGRFIANARLFKCPACNDFFNIRNSHEFEDQDFCRDCHDAESMSDREECALEAGN